jgi:putative hemolysin
VVGIVLAQDLLSQCVANKPFDLSLMKAPLFVPETMRALRALERFKESGMSMALLMDEYGGIEGLVTLIDILEAIVGDIPTPEEIVAPPIVQREDGSWLVDGLLTVDEFRETFDVKPFPGEGKYHTIGGFIVFMVGELPVPGQSVEWSGFRFEIMDMDGYRVDKVLVELLP